MRRTVLFAVMVGAGLAGCRREPLSPGEQSVSYPDYIYAIYKYRDAITKEDGGRFRFAPGVRIGLVQAGEPSPPHAAVGTLAAEKDLVGGVAPIPAFPSARWREVPAWHPGMRSRVDVERRALGEIHEGMKVTRRFAQDLGLDYVFVYGGTIDYESRGGAIKILDLTIVGRYVIPSSVTRMSGTATGVLIRVADWRPVMAVNTGLDLKGIASSAGYRKKEGDMLGRIRADLSVALVKELTRRLREEVALGAEAAGPTVEITR